MARKSQAKRPKIYTNWYLREWMDSLEVNQATMIDRTGWSKTKASHLYNSQQDHSSIILDEAADALKIAPFELLMKPSDAMAMRRIRAEALRIAAEAGPQGDPPAAERHIA